MFLTLITAFGLVFLAELGDKTQLTTMLLAANNNENIITVFIGATAALVLSSLIGVLAGNFISNTIPIKYIQNGAGIAFILIGILLLFNKY